MTLGDVLAVVAGLVGAAVSWAAVLLLTALLFPAATQRACNRLELRPWRSLLVGILLAGTIGASGVALWGAGPGGLKVLGFLLLFVLWLDLCIGAAGVTQLIGVRIGEKAPGLSPFKSLSYASAIFSVAMFFPFLGWFFVGPLVVFWSVGSGIAALRRHHKLERRHDLGGISAGPHTAESADVVCLQEAGTAP